MQEMQGWMHDAGSGSKRAKRKQRQQWAAGITPA
jgi:hypothetical protein